MGENRVGVTDQAAGAGVSEVRTRQRTVGGSSVEEQYVIPINERVASYKGTFSSFRTLGNAATPQNIFTISNTTGSSVLVAVRRLTVQMDATVVLTAVAPQLQLSRVSSAPTGGTVLTDVAFDTSLSGSANVEARGATASDGGAATAITATAGTTLWQQYNFRLHTAVGQVLTPDNGLIPDLCQDDPVILRANEHLLVQVVAAAAASNAATNHYIVQAMFEEFSLP